MTKLIDATVPKFLLVGVINTIVGAGTMFLLYNLAHCSYWFSSAANYVVGGIVSFFLNKYFTFHSTGWSWSQVVKFTVNLLVCYLAGYGLAREAADLFLADMDVVVRENAAMLAGMCLYTVLNYFGQRFWAFKKA